MPLRFWSGLGNRLFSDRVEFYGSLTGSEVQILTEDRDLDVLQCCEPVQPQTWELLNNEFFTRRPEVELRVFSFTTPECDLSFAARMSNVRHFSADCLIEATGVEAVTRMENLETLGVGIYKLDDFSFLEQVSPRLKKLFLGATRSKKPDLAALERFSELEDIFIEGQHKHIEVLSRLKTLRRVTLRSISTPDLSYLRPLAQMWFLDIKLGGITDLNAIQGMDGIKYLELWHILGLADIEVISSLAGLQYLLLQALRQITALPSLRGCRSLRRISLENLKGLKDISSLEFAPALEEFIHGSTYAMQPEDYIPLLRNPNLKRVWVWFGSRKRNARFEELLQAHHVEAGYPVHPFPYV